jgi:hypothetical protein
LAGGKRPHPSAPGNHEEDGPRLSLVTALPPSLWREHLGPMLYVDEALRLRVACKALKVLVGEWPMDLGSVKAGDLEAALTCFPATKDLYLSADDPLAPAEESRMVEVLRKHDGTLKRVVQYFDGARRLPVSAVRAGALPKLTYFEFDLDKPVDRQVLSEGMLGLLEEVQVNVYHEEGVPALEHLRRLPHLRCLMIDFYELQETAFPPFIPPSLKSLTLDSYDRATSEALLRGLPSMLQASGASLEQVCVGCHAEAAAALGQVLRACSSTLKTVGLDMKRLLGTACSLELVPGLVSCCDTLEVLECHLSLFGALPATGPAIRA